MPVTVIPLGTSGWMPTSTRQTMCFALETPEHLIFFDLGTGVSRLSSEEGEQLLARHKQVTVFLSHYHLDHIAGIVYLPRFFRNKRVTFAGPGSGIYGKSIETILGRLCSSPFFALRLSDFPFEITFQDLAPGPTRVGDLEVMTRLQVHPDPSLGFRVLDIAYITDTAYSPESIELCGECSLLIHEAMLDAHEYTKPKDSGHTIHSASNEAAQLAKEARVKMLMLAHLNPSYSKERLANMVDEARRIFLHTMLAEELVSVTV